MSELPDYNKITFPENPPIPFEEIVPDATEDAIDLLKKFLVYPSKEVILMIYKNSMKRNTKYGILVFKRDA